ncbi:hypothetical protein SLEP1_g8535 [Rubroshorea leprosula]|uniref:Uncharacterized protein n=1 Tax=Rubroshorea leprosula TaxID=152421 RepID=A0AAV5IBT8_9ROSI|nr:hypothetical protein SLEP1_g8535 [Rubroshorea leprosula]
MQSNQKAFLELMRLICSIPGQLCLQAQIASFQLVGAARTQAPSATNYDVGSSAWEDLRQVHLPSAMKTTSLGHGPC